mgnify:CR=1 FL=1
MHRTAKQIYNKIQEAKNILLVPHISPDGDALGSLTAFMQFLRSISKPHSAFCATIIPENLKNLPHAEYINTDDTVWNNNYDLIITLDCGDMKRAGIQPRLSKLFVKPIIINIDHHATNENFGTHNMVLPDSSSTAEVLYHFFKYNDIPIDATIATCLLAGLITDTDFFTNSSTSIKSLEITSMLIAIGGNIKLIKEIIFKNKTVGLLKVYGVILSRLKKHAEIDLIYTYITQQDAQKYAVSDTSLDEVTNFMNNISEVKACVIFKETSDGKIKCSFRTTRHDIDVSLITKQFGGGGHKKAAGCTIDGPLQTAAQKVFAKIKESENFNLNPSLQTRF